jgi:DNA repair photolyase
MIISVSRRTDIPAFYAPWLINRIKAGFALVPSPYNRKRLSRVTLTPDMVECLVFWSKNPAPLLDVQVSHIPGTRVSGKNTLGKNMLDWLDELGYRYYFQLTLTSYDRSVEKNLPDKAEILNTITRLSDRVGHSRVIWRYDPIILDDDFSPDFHKKAFAGLCAKLAVLVRHCVLSFADSYPHLERKIEKPEQSALDETAQALAEIAANHKLKLYACAEEADYADFGIQRSACVDGRVNAELNATTDSGFLLKLTDRKDRNQRKECGCVSSVDIGMYGSCLHGCTYCYAGQGRRHGSPQGLNAHDPESPMLCGWPRGDETVIDRV